MNSSSEKCERSPHREVATRFARPSSLLKRFATPDEVVFVRSELSSATNGAPLRVDGGVVLSPF